MPWKKIMIGTTNLRNICLEVDCEEGEPCEARIRASHGKGGPHVGVVEDGWLYWVRNQDEKKAEEKDANTDTYVTRSGWIQLRKEQLREIV